MSSSGELRSFFFGRKHSHSFSTQFTICISEFNFCISLNFTRRCCFGGVRCCVSLKGGRGIRGKVSGLPLLKLLCFCPTQHNATHHPFPLRITAPSGMKSPRPPAKSCLHSGLLSSKSAAKDPHQYEQLTGDVKE